MSPPEDLLEWIGQNKVYKDDPEFVSDELLHRVAASTADLFRLPARSLSLAQLL